MQFKRLPNTPAAERGAVFTRPEVVNFILDLVGYTSNHPLHKFRILEPSFGEGSFLIPIIDRLIVSWKNNNDTDQINCSFMELKNAIQAVELHRESLFNTKNKVINFLKTKGFSSDNAEKLASSWLVLGDFLLCKLDGKFHYVVGNPPYIRQEQIDASLLARYRDMYQTMQDRADIYVPFFERSLSLLDEDGVLGFICADRWMKNRYGAQLRAFVSRYFHIQAYIDMTGTSPFAEEVSTYPAITVISRNRTSATKVVRSPKIEPKYLAALSAEINMVSKAVRIEANADADNLGMRVQEIPPVPCGDAPWVFDSSEETALLRRLEQQYPLLEGAGCKVGIGVATGADKIFIGPLKKFDVEDDRLLPLVTTKDICSGEICWHGQGIVNPFDNSGSGLVHLNAYPRLAAYFEKHRNALAERHCAKKTPSAWYRTIDRIWPSLTHREKLLIPDIKGDAYVVYDAGKFYPHHNLYYITSDFWDLRALQAVLLSGIARLFIEAYSTKIRGGYLRFQAQYLRRIRLPHWQDVSKETAKTLRQAALAMDRDACREAVSHLYGLNSQERKVLERNRWKES